jgi:hypothetical protein
MTRLQRLGAPECSHENGVWVFWNASPTAVHAFVRIAIEAGWKCSAGKADVLPRVASEHANATCPARSHT